jgi:hypothetical protein
MRSVTSQGRYICCCCCCDCRPCGASRCSRSCLCCWRSCLAVTA